MRISHLFSKPKISGTAWDRVYHYHIRKTGGTSLNHMFLGSDGEDGLEKLATEVASKEFDVALIGAGAWALPLEVRIKQMGRCAIHMGGEMQLLFGIKGKRWEGRFIYNESWIRPFAEDTPTEVNRVEDGCYW